jgi:hypothetical protein
MSKLKVPLLIGLTAVCVISTAVAQGTGPSPYGSELGQQTTAPGSKGDRELQAKQKTHPPQKKPYRKAGQDQPPRADPSQDTGAR